MAIEPTNVVGVTNQWNASREGAVVSGIADDVNIAIQGQECPSCGTRSSVEDTLCLHCGEVLPNNQAASTSEKLEQLTLEKENSARTDEDSIQDTTSPTASDEVVAQSKPLRLAVTNSGSFNESMPMFSAGKDEPFAGLERLWLPNEATEICLRCNVQFGLGKRKHHCRVCGLIFCSSCLNSRVKLPESFGYGNREQRCCDPCNQKLQDGIVRSPADVFALRRGGMKKQASRDLLPTQSFVHQVMEQIAQATSSDFIDHYAVLGVKPDASMAEINAQFRSLVQVVQEGERLAAEGVSVAPPPVSFKDLNRSFNVLRDPESRSRFDAQLEEIKIEAMKKLREDASDVIKTKPMSRDCQVCFRPFTSFRRRHHCRRCGSSVCDPCSPDKKSIPEFGVLKPQRVCKNCVNAPPQLRRMLININALPLQGYEYLQTLELKAVVYSGSSADLLTITTGFEAASEKFTVTDKEAEILKSYNIEVKRRVRDFEWVHRQLGKVMPTSSLPPLPGKMKTGSDFVAKLNNYVRAIMWHPVLGDLDTVKAFLGMSNSDFATYVQQEGNYAKDYLANFATLERWLRFRLEQEQVRQRIQQAQRRVTAVNSRLTAYNSRDLRQTRRKEEQLSRQDEVVNGASVVEAIKAKQALRIARETERFQQQDNASKILFIDREADEKERQAEATEAAMKKDHYVHKKNKWLNEMEEWQADMSAWTLGCSQRTAQATPKAGLAVNDWLLKHSSMPWADIVNDIAQPQALQLMRQNMENLEAEEPEKLTQEQQLSTVEWARLVEEENRLKEQRVHLDKEEKLWTEWDVAAEREAAFIAAEQARRKEKEAIIDADVSRIEKDIEARRENQKKRWLLIDAREKKLLDGEQELHKRLAAYQARESSEVQLLDEINKRISLEKSRLEAQKREQRILRFIRDAEDEGRLRAGEILKKFRYELAMSQSDFDRYRAALPEGLDATEVDLMIEATEMQEVDRGNPRTEAEWQKEDYDERDNFMNNIKRRRQAVDKKIEEEKQLLLNSSNRCRQLMARIQFMAQQFDTENSRVIQENETLDKLNDMLATEEALVQEEQQFRAFKIQTLQQKLDEAASTVEQLTGFMNDRTKSGIERATRQTGTIEVLKKMQIETAKRIDNRQAGIMQADKRKVELSKRLELFQSENWQKGITLNSGVEYNEHRGKFQEGLNEFSLAENDTKKLAELGPRDLDSLNDSVERQHNDKIVLGNLMPTLNSVETIFGSEMSAVLENEDIPLTDRFRQKVTQIRALVEKLKTGLETEEANTSTESVRLDSEKVVLNDLLQNLMRERDLISLENQNLVEEKLLLDQEQTLLTARCDEAGALYRDLRNEHDKTFDVCNKLIDQHRKRVPPSSRAPIIASIRENVLATERRSEVEDARGKAVDIEANLLKQIAKAKQMLSSDEATLRVLIEKGQTTHQELLKGREQLVTFVFEDDVFSKVMAWVNGMAPAATLMVTMPWLEKLQSQRSDIIQRRQQHLKHLDQEIRVIVSENLRVQEALQTTIHQSQELQHLEEAVKREAELWKVHKDELSTNTGRLPRATTYDSDSMSMDIDAIRARRVIAQSQSVRNMSTPSVLSPQAEVEPKKLDHRGGSFEL